MIFLYLVLIVIAVLFFILYEGVASLIILSIVIVFPLLLFFINCFLQSKITAALSCGTKTCSANQSVTLDIELKNPTPIPVLSSEISLTYTISSTDKKGKISFNTPIFSNSTQHLTTTLSSEHYGVVAFNISRVKLYDILKLFRNRLPKKSIHSDVSIIVMPNVVELSNPVCDYSEIGLDSDLYSDTKSGSDPSQIFDIRDYTDGDKMSRVHWKLTAKEDKLMVKEYSRPICDSFLILLDSFIPLEKLADAVDLFDTGTSLALSLSNRLLWANSRHILAVYSEDSHTLSEASVDDEQSQIDALIALLTAKRATAPNMSVKALSAEHSNLKYGHLILICSYADSDTISLLSSSGLAYRYSVLVCGEKTTALTSLSTSNTEVYLIDSKNLELSLSDLTL
ncbi:MAG: DUF58 domain-containing protein [Ruminococcus sp.]|nr:DUF58 domain-containing protein [Ruminococcus sp.]